MSLMSGSPTTIGWKRRSSAASFSMCLRYSSRVVAPTQRNSPRASIGFSRLAASTAPSAAPAPTIVCSSSRKRTIWPCAAWTSVRIAFSRSSNSPLNLAPASSVPMSSAITRRSRRLSGTSPSTIRCASPSTIAVLPTPGSPISTGLFFLRRERTWITRRISSSRPITGSSSPLSASAVRSRPYFSSACIVSSGLGDVTLCGPRTSAIASSSGPRSGRSSATPELESVSASRMCSVEMYSSPSFAIAFSAPWSTLTRAGEGRTSAVSLSFGRSSTRCDRLSGHAAHVDAQLLQNRDDQPVFLAQQRDEQVGGGYLGVAALGGKRLRRGDGFLGLDREAIGLHWGSILGRVQPDVH